MHFYPILLIGVRAASPTSFQWYGDLIAAGFIVLMLLVIKYLSVNSKNLDHGKYKRA
jgi:hypothetical protein